MYGGAPDRHGDVLPLGCLQVELLHTLKTYFSLFLPPSLPLLRFDRERGILALQVSP